MNNIYTSKLAHWYIARATRQFTHFATIPLQVSLVFFSTWAEVYRAGHR